MILIKATGRRAEAEVTGLLTSGSVGIPIEVELSEDFDGLTTFLCYRAGEATADHVIHESMAVPPQVLATHGVSLYAGVYACDSENNVVIPTVWADCGRIRMGAALSGVEPLEPAPSWVADVQAAAVKAEEVAQSVRDDADAGVFKGDKGDTGEPATDVDIDRWVIYHENAQCYVVAGNAQLSFSAHIGAERAACTLDINAPGSMSVAANVPATTEHDGVLVLTWSDKAALADGNAIPVTLHVGDETFPRNLQLRKVADGSSSVHVHVGTDLVTVPCNSGGYASSSDGCEVPFSAWLGETRVACTCNYPSVPSGVTTVVRNATDMSDGFIRFSWSRGAYITGFVVTLMLTCRGDLYYHTVRIATVRDGYDGTGLFVSSTSVPIPSPSSTGTTRTHVIPFGYSNPDGSMVEGVTGTVTGLPSGMSWSCDASTRTTPATLNLSWPGTREIVDSDTGQFTITVTRQEGTVDIPINWHRVRDGIGITIMGESIVVPCERDGTATETYEKSMPVYGYVGYERMACTVSVGSGAVGSGMSFRVDGNGTTGATIVASCAAGDQIASTQVAINVTCNGRSFTRYVNVTPIRDIDQIDNGSVTDAMLDPRGLIATVAALERRVAALEGRA